MESPVSVQGKATSTSRAPLRASTCDYCLVYAGRRCRSQALVMYMVRMHRCIYICMLYRYGEGKQKLLGLQR